MTDPIPRPMVDSDRVRSRRAGAISFHLAVCGIGLAGVLTCAIRAVARSAVLRTPTELADWARFFNFPEKRPEILGYCASIAVVFVFFAIAAILRHRSEIPHRYPFFVWLARRTVRLLGHGAVTSIANLIPVVGAFLADVRPGAVVLLGTVWILNTAVPFLPVLLRIAEAAAGKRAAPLLFVAAALGFAFVFYPFILKEPRMINEYLDIPEHTLLPMPDGTIAVSNAEYIENHGLFGLRPYVRARDGDCDPEPKPAQRARVRLTPALEILLKEGLREGSDDGTADADLRKRAVRKVFYDHRRGELVAASALTEGEFAILGAAVAPEDRHPLRQLDSTLEAATSRVATPEEREFCARNRLELHWQILNRWVIHHHNFVLGAINEYDRGRPPSEINAQYGWLNIAALRAVLKLSGGITYQNYLRVFYSGYVVYFVLFLGVAALLLRGRAYVALVAILTVGAYQVIGFQYLFLGSGLNPIRHFFDLFVVAGLALYFRRARLLWLGIACAASVLGVLNNTQFGLFALLALTGVLSIRAVCQFTLRRTMIETLFLLPTFAVCLYWLLRGKMGQDYMGSYYAQGFCGFPTHAPVLPAILIASWLGYLVFSRRSESAAQPDRFLFLFLLLYSQALLIYYVWGATRYHLLNLAPIYVLTAVLGLRLFFSTRAESTERKSVGVALLTALCLYAGSAVHFVLLKREYDRVFSTHVVHEWKFPTARFQSTMDPAPFQDGVERIHRYSHAPAIHIVSRYDNILPFLAERYSAMPFPDVSWFLLSEKEIRICRDAIVRDSPEFLFVDADIDRPHLNEIVEPHYSKELHVESVLRIERLECLREVFRQVSHLYEPIESGTLIGVYRRKTM